MEKIRRFRIKKDSVVQEAKDTVFDSASVKKFCDDCFSKMLPKYRKMYNEWVKDARSVFAKMKLSLEQQWILCKRQAAVYLAGSITDQYGLYGDIDKLVKEADTAIVLMRRKYVNIAKEVDKKYPNLFAKVEASRKGPTNTKTR